MKISTADKSFCVKCCTCQIRQSYSMRKLDHVMFCRDTNDKHDNYLQFYMLSNLISEATSSHMYPCTLQYFFNSAQKKLEKYSFRIHEHMVTCRLYPVGQSKKHFEQGNLIYPQSGMVWSIGALPPPPLHPVIFTYITDVIFGL